jgi:hypothetical protein
MAFLGRLPSSSASFAAIIMAIRLTTSEDSTGELE